MTPRAFMKLWAWVGAKARLFWAGFASVAAVLGAAFVTSGCASCGLGSAATTAPVQPKNTYRSEHYVPTHVRRLAVLPVAFDPENWQAEEGLAEIEPVLFAELGKTR